MIWEFLCLTCHSIIFLSFLIVSLIHYALCVVGFLLIIIVALFALAVVTVPSDEHFERWFRQYLSNGVTRNLGPATNFFMNLMINMSNNLFIPPGLVLRSLGRYQIHNLGFCKLVVCRLVEEQEEEEDSEPRREVNANIIGIFNTWVIV